MTEHAATPLEYMLRLAMLAAAEDHNIPVTVAQTCLLAQVAAKVAEGMGTDQPEKAPLTERQMQVLIGIANGLSNAEIGRKLWLTEDGVKSQVRLIFRRLGARDRAHAVGLAMAVGLLSPSVVRLPEAVTT